MSNRRWLAAALALTLLATAVTFAACGGDDDDASAAGQTPAAKASPTAAGVAGSASPQTDFGKRINETRIPEELADGEKIGKPDARLVIEMYEDFGCPHCLEFTAVVEPVLMNEYVATGKAQLVYRYFPLRQLTAVAAIGSYCAGEQGKFWPFHRLLFIAQAEANEKKGPALTEAFAVDGLTKIAADLQLDSAKFTACLTSDAAIAAVQAGLKSANELGLPGTPSFVINGKVTDTPASLTEWRKLLDGLLK